MLIQSRIYYEGGFDTCPFFNSENKFTFTDNINGRLEASVLSPKNQAQLDQLLIKNSQNQLSNQESETLDKLLAQIDQLNIIKTRARYTLNFINNQQQVA